MCDNILLYYLDQSPPTSLSSSSIGCRPVMISFFYWHQACFLFYWTLGMLPKLYNCPQLLRTTFIQIQNVSLKHNLKRIIQNFETHHCSYMYIIMTPSILAIIVLVLFPSRWLHKSQTVPPKTIDLFSVPFLSQHPTSFPWFKTMSPWTQLYWNNSLKSYKKNLCELTLLYLM